MSNDTIEVKISLPVIEGYEYTGEFRYPNTGDSYLGSDNTVLMSLGGTNYIARYPIMRKTSSYRKPNSLKDLGKTARFMHNVKHDDTSWYHCILTAIGTEEYYDIDGLIWPQCEVLEED